MTVDRRTKDLKYEKNPFHANTIAEVDIGFKTTTFGTGQNFDNRETGESIEAGFKQVRVVDKSQFLMFYLAGQQVFWQLSKRAQKALRLIFNEVQHRAIGKDEIYLSWELGNKFFKENGIKMGRSTYFKAIAELSDKKVIAESIRTNIWFINPVLIFNGNRATFVQTLISNDPTLLDEAQEITAKRALEALDKLDDGALDKIGNDFITSRSK
jgi:hypothetical protein